MWVDPNSGVSIIKQRLKKLLLFDVHRGNTEIVCLESDLYFCIVVSDKKVLKCLKIV